MVHAHGVVALFLQHSDHAEWYAVESHCFSYRVSSVGEKVIYDGLSEYAHLRACLDICVGKHIAVSHAYLTYLHVVLVDAVDGRGGVLVAVYELSAFVHHGTDSFDIRTLVLDALVVVHLQRLHRGCVLPYASTPVSSRSNHYHVRAHLRNVCLYAFLRALSHCKHSDDRSDADDDTECSQERACLVGSDGSYGYFK